MALEYGVQIPKEGEHLKIRGQSQKQRNHREGKSHLCLDLQLSSNYFKHKGNIQGTDLEKKKNVAVGSCNIKSEIPAVAYHGGDTVCSLKPYKLFTD